MFCFPIILGTLFQQMYNAADVIVVGHFVGKEALACVGGSSGTVINLVVGFFVGLSSGATVIVSRAYGAGKTAELDKAVHASMALSVVGSVILMAAGFIWTPKILEMMDTLQEVVEGSLLTGDLTFNGARKSHEDLAGKLAKIESAGIPVLVISGNHDLDNRYAASFSGDGYELVPGVSPAGFEGLYAAFGYEDAVSRDQGVSFQGEIVYEKAGNAWIF